MKDEEYSQEEAERRAAANLRRLLATPPKPKEKPATTRKNVRVAKSGKRGQAASAS